MSGGFFDYNQFLLNSISESILDIIEKNDNEDLDEWGDPVGRGYSPEVIENLREIALTTKVAAIGVNRADWLLSGDDGEEAFLRRLKEDLDEIKSEFIEGGE